MNTQDIKKENGIDGGSNEPNKHSLLSMQRATSQALLTFLAKRLGYNIEDIKQKNRKRELVLERQRFYYLCKINNICSLSVSASYFNQNHATALHGYKTICDLMETEKLMFSQMQVLDKLVKEVVLNLKLFTWVENDKTKVDEMFYKGKLVGYYDRNTNMYKIICQPFYIVPSMLPSENRIFIENEFLKFLDCII